ncbi:hypothetical protein ACFFV7_08015 [Nonomuraea spiralis]|uniref:Uncharacterized protein n=1 Tax=Nonomuraea spiralis TaxID=46182 RepID=A0ABV5IAM8_9ACTN|nr:hypothetical protein [Nonomuraea spiralis]GGS77131.1 hypothetical protein GCM10010176_020400 [Nonomuraea spiralis]
MIARERLLALVAAHLTEMIPGLGAVSASYQGGRVIQRSSLRHLERCLVMQRLLSYRR